MCGNKPMYGYCSGHHQTGDHKCKVVAGCTAKQGSLCGHTLEKCPNCNGSPIAFSNRCPKKTKAASVARPSRHIEQAGEAPTDSTTGVALGTNTVVLGPCPKCSAVEGGGMRCRDAGCGGEDGNGGGRRRYDDRDRTPDRDINWNWNGSPCYQSLKRSSTTVLGRTSGQLWR